MIKNKTVHGLKNATAHNYDNLRIPVKAIIYGNLIFKQYYTIYNNKYNYLGNWEAVDELDFEPVFFFLAVSSAAAADAAREDAPPYNTYNIQ